MSWVDRWNIGVKKGLGFCEVGLGILDGIVRAVGGDFVERCKYFEEGSGYHGEMVKEGKV